MKALLRVAAALSFAFFSAGGLLLIHIGCACRTDQDAALPWVLGLLFLGTAFFVGPLLLAVAERIGRKGDAK